MTVSSNKKFKIINKLLGTILIYGQVLKQNIQLLKNRFYQLFYAYYFFKMIYFLFFKN